MAPGTPTAGQVTRDDEWRVMRLEVFDTNVVGVIRVTRAALPLLRNSGNLVVVDISSALSSLWAVTNPEQPLHVPAIVCGASMAAVSMLTAQYAKALLEITFNAVEPGFTSTGFGGGGGGRLVAESATVIVRIATTSKDGATGTFQEATGELAW